MIEWAKCGRRAGGSWSAQSEKLCTSKWFCNQQINKQNGKKKAVWWESQTSIDSECQQRSAVCVYRSCKKAQSWTEVAERKQKETQRGDQTVNDAKPLFKAWPAVQAPRRHIYLLANLSSKQETNLFFLFFFLRFLVLILNKLCGKFSSSQEMRALKRYVLG